MFILAIYLTCIPARAAINRLIPAGIALPGSSVGGADMARSRSVSMGGGFGAGRPANECGEDLFCGVPRVGMTGTEMIGDGP